MDMEYEERLSNELKTIHKYDTRNYYSILSINQNPLNSCSQ